MISAPSKGITVKSQVFIHTSYLLLRLFPLLISLIFDRTTFLRLVPFGNSSFLEGVSSVGNDVIRDEGAGGPKEADQ